MQSAIRAVLAEPRFPPSFDDNPVSYALALASLSCVSFIALGVLLSWWFDARGQKAIRAMVFNEMGVSQGPGFWQRVWRRQPLTLLHYHRLLMGGFLLTFVFALLPDTFVMLAWGEASAHMMVILFSLDRFGDALAVIPFLTAVITGYRCRDALFHQLTIRGEYHPQSISWKLVRDRMRAVILLIVMSIGVAVYKSQL